MVEFAKRTRPVPLKYNNIHFVPSKYYNNHFFLLAVLCTAVVRRVLLVSVPLRVIRGTLYLLALRAEILLIFDPPDLPLGRSPQFSGIDCHRFVETGLQQ